MKNTLILLFSLFISLCSAQNIKAVYIRTDLASIGDDTVIPEKMKPSLHTFEYSNGKSLYKIQSTIKSSIDVVGLETQGVKHNSVRSIVVPTEDTYYKETKNNLYRRELSSGNEDFSIKDKLREFNWKLTDETKVIKGYKCKKATAVLTAKSLDGTFPAYAWYCEAIPVNDGPAFFWGLPGLILMVNLDGKYEIAVKELTVVKDDFVVEEPINKRPMITNAELK
jgi:GLPGLI family protein